MMKIIDSQNYKIYVGEETIRFLPEVIAKIQPSQMVFLYDENSQKYCSPLIDKLLYSVRYLKQFDKDLIHTIVVPSGENHKNMETITEIWKQLLEKQIDRKALMVCIGGGVVCDMGNFAASLWKRGIRCVLISTTLLSMIDASCGGKTGIDFQNYKNLIGTFANPAAVISDPIFLQTLSQREMRSGFAEMLKHAIIAGDIREFLNIETIDYKTVIPYISESIELKNKIVLQDWKEENLRKILNFGHTIGHALERLSFSTEQPLLHGEAVALGMLAEAHLAHLFAQIDAELLKNITTVVERFYTSCKFAFNNDAILHNMLNDKKNQSGKIVISLPFPNQFLTLDLKKDGEKIVEALKMINCFSCK